MQDALYTTVNLCKQCDSDVMIMIPQLSVFLFRWEKHLCKCSWVMLTHLCIHRYPWLTPPHVLKWTTVKRDVSNICLKNQWLTHSEIHRHTHTHWWTHRHIHRYESNKLSYWQALKLTFWCLNGYFKPLWHIYNNSMFISPPYILDLKYQLHWFSMSQHIECYGKKCTYICIHLTSRKCQYIANLLINRNRSYIFTNFICRTVCLISPSCIGN